jgi:hypothetical protein
MFMTNGFCTLVAAVLVFSSLPTETGLCGEIIVPAFTAYMSPEPSAAHISEEHGVTHWDDPNQTVNWFGKFRNKGELTAKILVRLDKNAESRLLLSIGETSREVKIVGRDGKAAVEANFGSFQIPGAGHHRIELKSLNPAGHSAADIQSLVIEGPAAEGVHFNMKERRNAASVHLAYPTELDLSVAAFYCEVTAVEEPVTTFYMACGWHRGYFGMQVNSEKERRIIFSVWDSGDEAIDRKKVVDENRVRLMGKGEGVYSGDFGNEGTGGHSHLKYLWKTGEKQRFLVTAEPVEKSFTVFSGYWFHPDRNEWMLISSWKAPKEGGYLRGLHSFSENFGGENGHLLRKARYGNQWVRTADQKWIELTTATFSHDPTGKSDRFDRYMGVEEGQFFLSHGGFLDGYCDFGDKFDRPATGTAPADLKLPAIK